MFKNNQHCNFVRYFTTDIKESSDTTLLTHKTKTNKLKEEKLKAKLLLKEATYNWRIENLLLREIAREELKKLNNKQAKELKIRQKRLTTSKT